MIIVDCEQKTDEWYQSRLSIPTASEIDKIITPGLKLSAQATGYMNMLTAEWISGQQEEDRFVSYWMERGTELEPEAREAYEFETGQACEQVGFVYKDEERLVGCSPDGLILDAHKGAEMKCPKRNNHLAYAVGRECPKKYQPQIQSSMWICDLDEWDFISYHPDFGLFITTVYADPKWQRALDTIMPDFIGEMLIERERDDVISLRELRQAMEVAA